MVEKLGQPESQLSSPRPSVDDLRKQVKTGEISPCAAVNRILRHDADILMSALMYRDDPPEDAVTKLYRLEDADFINLDFLCGFFTVVHSYSILENFVREGSYFWSRMAPIGESILDALGFKRNSKKPQGAMDDEEFKKMLKKDPSGETWLKEDVVKRQNFQPESLEFSGASKAIAGAVKLYEMITHPEIN